jgi:hypothetical protein
MARFTGTLEDLFDDAPQTQRAAVRADVEAASVAADGAALALEQDAQERDDEAEDYGICDEPTDNGVCGARFTLPADAAAVSYCPTCGSSAIIEHRATASEADACYECQRAVGVANFGRFGVCTEQGDRVIVCASCYAAEIAEGELAYDRERCIERDVPNPAPNVFKANWHELIEAQADPTLDAFASDWDLMADRSRAIMARTLPTHETILGRLLTRRNKKAAGKAAQAVVEGVRIRRNGDALVIASQSESREWTVNANGCNCRARSECFHGELYAVTVGWEA